MLKARKAVIQILRVLLVGHLLPVTLFAFTVFMASAVVTACSPSRGSTLRDGAPNAAQASLKSAPAVVSPPAAQTELQKKLSGTWQCSAPSDSKAGSVPCFGQGLIFSDSLDKMSENTFVSLDDNQGKCHVQIEYSLTVVTDQTGDISLQLGQATLGSLISDPANDEDCSADFKNAAIPNISRHQQLSHSDDWKQITYDDVTYTRADTSTGATHNTETWPSP